MEIHTDEENTEDALLEEGVDTRIRITQLVDKIRILETQRDDLANLIRGKKSILAAEEAKYAHILASQNAFFESLS